MLRDMAVCKICYDDHEPMLTGICACRGSVGSVHRHCIVKWLETRARRPPVRLSEVIIKSSVAATLMWLIFLVWNQRSNEQEQLCTSWVCMVWAGEWWAGDTFYNFPDNSVWCECDDHAWSSLTLYSRALLMSFASCVVSTCLLVVFPAYSHVCTLFGVFIVQVCVWCHVVTSFVYFVILYALSAAVLMLYTRIREEEHRCPDCNQTLHL